MVQRFILTALLMNGGLRGVGASHRPQLIDLGPKYSRGITNVISLQFLMINK